MSTWLLPIGFTNEPYSWPSTDFEPFICYLDRKNWVFSVSWWWLLYSFLGWGYQACCRGGGRQQCRWVSVVFLASPQCLVFGTGCVVIFLPFQVNPWSSEFMSCLYFRQVLMDPEAQRLCWLKWNCFSVKIFLLKSKSSFGQDEILFSLYIKCNFLLHVLGDHLANATYCASSDTWGQILLLSNSISPD